MTRYQGDDLINLITVRIKPKEEGDELPEIEFVELKIGCLDKRYKQPENPFTVSLTREESLKLSINNKCYAAIWFWEEVDGVRKLFKKTCDGTLTIQTKAEVVNGGCCC